MDEHFVSFGKPLNTGSAAIAQRNRHRFDGTNITTVQPSKTTVVHSQATALHSRHVASAYSILVPGVAVCMERYTVGGVDTKGGRAQY